MEILFNFSSAEKELNRLTLTDGATPLHIAVAGGQIELAVNILIHGADVNAKNSNGDTPLHLAMAFPGDLLARALLAYKADLTIKNMQGKRPSTVARERGNQQLSDLMLEFEDNRDALPDRKDIQKELSLKEVEKIRKFTYSRNTSGPSVNVAKVNEMEGRIHAIEENIEKIFDVLTKFRNQPDSKSTGPETCASCFAPNAKECPHCHIFFCDTCMKKAARHKCVTKK